MHKFAIFLLLMLLSTFVSAQTENTTNFKYWLKELNAEFILPKGFKELDKDELSSLLPRGKMIGGQVYRVYNLKGITISIDILAAREAGFLGGGARKSIDSVFNTDYLRGQADLKDDAHVDRTVVPKMAYLKSNADSIIIYTLKIRKKEDYPSVYGFVKRFVFHKNDIGDIALNFLGKDSSDEPKIDKYIQANWGIVKFRADSMYSPTFEIDLLIGKFYNMRPKQTAAQLQAKADDDRWTYIVTSLFNGREFLRDHKFKEALSNCNDVLKLDPKNRPAFLIGIEAMLGLGNLDGAISMAKQGVLALGKSYDEQCIQADKLVKIGKPKEALAVYSSILK